MLGSNQLESPRPFVPLRHFVQAGRRCLMKNISFVLVALVLLPGLAVAQSGGPNTYGYEYSTTSFDFVTVPASVTSGPTVDDGEVSMTLPWNFDWYGTS